MENQVKKIEISSIKDIESIKNMALSKGQNEVVKSVTNNGLHIPIQIDSDNSLVDGRLRVRAYLDLAKTHIEAYVVKKQDNSSEVASSKYIMNNHRHNMSAAERSELALAAIGANNNEDLFKDKCMKLGIQTSDDDLKSNNPNSKISKSHLTKYKRINELPDDIKSKIDENEIPINASYELGKGCKAEDLDKEDLMQLVEEIKEMSDRKAISHIKKYIKNKQSADDVTVNDERVEAVKFRKTTITIDITKHFQDDKYIINDLTDDHKRMIRELIDKVFEYLKSSHYPNYEAKESSSPKQHTALVNGSTEEGEAA